MKHFLLPLLFLPFISQAQLELGLNLGAAMNTKPNGNLFYQGTKSPVNPAASIKGLYSFGETWQAGIDVTLTQLSRKSEDVYTYHTGGTIGGDDKKLVLAKTYTAVCGLFNGKLTHKNGYMYGGLAIGYGVARHNSQTRSSNESYRTPDGGNGFVVGLQMGYVTGISKSLAWNVEASGRRLDLQYDAQAPYITPSSNMHYSVYDVMVSIGLRLRFKDDADKEKELQDAMNIGGE